MKSNKFEIRETKTINQRTVKSKLETNKILRRRNMKPTTVMNRSSMCWYKVEEKEDEIMFSSSVTNNW
jgi:hypothetical protein